jgi:hypothetical protein
MERTDAEFVRMIRAIESLRARHFPKSAAGLCDVAEAQCAKRVSAACV